VIGSDGLVLTVEEELLSSSVLSPSSEPKVVGTVAFSNSLHWKSGSEVEWLVANHSEVLMKSFSLIFIRFINIDNLPFLVVAVMLVPNDNCSSFFILASVNIKGFTILPVDEVSNSVSVLSSFLWFFTFNFILEDLEPS
jgi:hypothetical protein